MKGLTNDDKARRYSMIEYNMNAIMGLMRDSGFDDPVGLLIDPTDNYGKEIAQAIFETNYGKGSKDKFVDQCQSIDRIPTMMTVITLEQAKEILTITSPTATKNLATPRPPNTHFVVAIAGGGNSYAGVLFAPDGKGKSIKDGQHRTGG